MRSCPDTDIDRKCLHFKITNNLLTVKFQSPTKLNTFVQSVHCKTTYYNDIY